MDSTMSEFAAAVIAAVDGVDETASSSKVAAAVAKVLAFENLCDGLDQQAAAAAAAAARALKGLWLLRHQGFEGAVPDGIFILVRREVVALRYHLIDYKLGRGL